MWSIKQRRTKPRTVGNKVIYPKLNATATPNRYVNRNTYLDVKCNKDKGAGCTIVGCQCSILKHVTGIFISGAKGNNTLIYSIDGVNWTGLGNTVFGNRVNSVKWNGEIWTAVGGYKDTNTLGYSYDGFTWVGVGDPFSSGPTSKGLDIASNGSEWMAISSNATIIKSINGIVWEPTGTKPPISFFPNGIAYGQNKWLVFGTNGATPTNNIYYSQDNGDNWTQVTTPFSVYANRGFYNGSIWVGVGLSTAASIVWSDDGVIWTAASGVGITSAGQDVFYNGSIWVAGGGGAGASIVWSNDGKTWIDATNQLLLSVNGVTWNSSINLWVATSGNSSSTYDIIYSQDGKTWTGVPKNATLMNPGSAYYLDSGPTTTTTMYCCKTAPYRNPILGYRKHLVDCSGNSDLSGCGYTNDVSGNVYKDNYAKSCGDPANSLVCYNPVIKLTQNRNGCVDESYNYSTNQYLTRRCLTFAQQEFNFQSQVPVDASGCCTKFRSCANCQYDSSGACNCSTNGFCTPCGHSQACIGINKLPCEVKNTKCFAIYKRSNPKFNRQGAVSGGSRINRLKYQTRVVAAQRRKPNGRNNVINRREPAALYTTSRPLTMNAPGCWLNKGRTRNGLAQRCVFDPLPPPHCCDETLPEGVIKLCTVGNPGCDDCPGGYDYEIVGYLNQPVAFTWAGDSGCDPSCGRLGQLPYPTVLGTICPPDASYRSNTIGGFAWNFNPTERHLWFFLQINNGFDTSGGTASGYQFTSVEFSSSSSFLPANTVKLYGRELDIDYKSNTEYEVHWSGEDELTNWSSATINKIDDIFGTALNANKNVYIQFDLDSPVLAVVPGGFAAIPGASPSYITIQYNQSLGPAPAKENFSAENVTQVVPLMDILAIDIITTDYLHDTVRIELGDTAIAEGDLLDLSYDTSGSPYIINSTGTQLAPIFSNQSITAPTTPITDANFIVEVDVWLNTGSNPTYGIIENWDVSGVTDMSNAFSFFRNSNAATFNNDIGNWNTSAVTSMASMFHVASIFDQDISAWDVSLVTDMAQMFAGTDNYNNGGQPLSTGVSGWITTNVTDMHEMFYAAYLFNQPVNWDTSNVTDMNGMFQSASVFNQDISGWDVSGTNNFYYMFDNAVAFNQDIRSWVVHGNPQPTSNMFYQATAFLAVYGCSAPAPVPHCIPDIPPYTGAPPCDFFVSPDC